MSVWEAERHNFRLPKLMGPELGADGYGFIKYKYIVRNIYGTYVMEAHGY